MEKETKEFILFMIAVGLGLLLMLCPQWLPYVMG